MSSSKRSRYADSNKPSYVKYRKGSNIYLQAGMMGFLATAEGFNENGCKREAYHILNKYADILFGSAICLGSPEIKEACEENDHDVAKQLEAVVEQENSKAKRNWRFQKVETEVSNCLFIQSTLSEIHMIAEAIVLAAKNQEVSLRSLMRLVPIERVCLAQIEAIERVGSQLIHEHFHNNTCTYAIAYNKRYNNNLRRDDVVDAVAAIVKKVNAECTVDLKNPKRSIIIEVIKGMCCMSVIEDYILNKRHNLQELAKNPSKDTQTKTCTEQDILDINKKVLEDSKLSQPLVSVLNCKSVQTDAFAGGVTIQLLSSSQRADDTNPNAEQTQKE